MLAKDFITQTRIELDEKASEHWSNEELFIKLQRSYVSLQYDIPFFLSTETVDIKKGITEYYLTYTALKNVGMSIDGTPYTYSDIENFYLSDTPRRYTFDENRMLLYPAPLEDASAVVVYRHEKRLENENCHIELPAYQHKALRLLFMSEIHEKPTRNTKERNLSLHYLKLYEAEKVKLKVEKKMRPRNITTNYQRI